MRPGVRNGLIESLSCLLRLGPSRSKYLNKRADWIPAFAGMTAFEIPGELKKRGTPFGGRFQTFLPQTPRQMAFCVFCFASLKVLP